MLVAAIHLQLGSHCTPELALGKHALDSLFQDLFRLACQEARKGLFAQAAGETGVATVKFLLALETSQPHFFSINDDYVIAHIDVRNVLGIQLAAQHTGRLGSQPAQRLAAGIYHKPFAVNILAARNKGRHLSPAFNQNLLSSGPKPPARLKRKSDTLAQNISAHAKRARALIPPTSKQICSGEDCGELALGGALA